MVVFGWGIGKDCPQKVVVFSLIASQIMSLLIVATCVLLKTSGREILLFSWIRRIKREHSAKNETEVSHLAECIYFTIKLGIILQLGVLKSTCIS